MQLTFRGMDLMLGFSAATIPLNAFGRFVVQGLDLLAGLSSMTTPLKAFVQSVYQGMDIRAGVSLQAGDEVSSSSAARSESTPPSQSSIATFQLRAYELGCSKIAAACLRCFCGQDCSTYCPRENKHAID